MQRRNFIRTLIGAIAAPKVIEALPIPPTPAVEAVAAPALPAAVPLDIREMLMQAMLREIQEEEDRLFINAINRYQPHSPCNVATS